MRKALSVASLTLAPLETIIAKRFSSKKAEEVLEKFPPIFIVGPPRSGTTLVYETLCACLNVQYLDNLSETMHRTPTLAHKLSNLLSKEPHTPSFTSDYGYISGWSAPSEAGEFWYRWFPRAPNVFVTADALSETQKKNLYLQIALYTLASKKSIVFKNTYNSLRIQALRSVFPTAIFVKIARNPLETANSIWQYRTKHSPKDWWSAPPKEVDILKNLPLTDQIAGQVHYIDKQIQEDTKDMPDNQVTTIHYGEFCNDPIRTLNESFTRILHSHTNLTLDTSTIPHKFAKKELNSKEEHLINLQASFTKLESPNAQ